MTFLRRWVTGRIVWDKKHGQHRIYISGADMRVPFSTILLVLKKFFSCLYMPNELRLLRFQVLQLPPMTLSFVVDNYIIFVYPKHAKTLPEIHRILN